MILFFKHNSKTRGKACLNWKSRILKINLNGYIWTKMGSMISHHGNMKFVREKMLEHEIEKYSRELCELVHCSGVVDCRYIVDLYWLR